MPEFETVMVNDQDFHGYVFERIEMSNVKFKISNLTPSSPFPLGSSLPSRCSAHTQISPGHLLRLRKPPHSQNRGRDILQRSIPAQREVLCIFADHNEGHGVARVRSVGAAGGGIDHHFRVAVV